MIEKAKWEPQGLPEPPKDSPPPPSNLGPIAPTVPNENKKGSLPWFLWVLIGCGCGAPLLIGAFVVFIFFILGLNSKSSANDTSFYTNEITTVGKSISDCIAGEKAKGTNVKRIYSLETCANKDFLYDSHYSTYSIISDTRILVSSGNDKICAYITYYDFKEKQDEVTSWDSDTNGLSEKGKGTKTCSDSNYIKTTNTATKSATKSAK